MPNIAQVQLGLPLQIQGVEISSGNTIVNRLLSIATDAVTELVANFEYFTGNGPFELASTIEIHLAIIVNKSAANSAAVSWNNNNLVGAGPTQFSLGPSGIFFFFDPTAANFLGSLTVGNGANTLNIETITGTLS